MNEHQENDGTLKPPSSQEQTDLPVEGLTQPAPMVRLTLDQADTLRAERAYTGEPQSLPQWFLSALDNQGFQFSMWIINNCPEGKQRSQALGQIEAAVIWAQRAGIRP